jgi:hypothetical protein
MSVGTFIEELRRLGVKLKVQGAGLTYDGPEEAVTPELVARMTTFKGEIIAALASGEPDTATEQTRLVSFLHPVAGEDTAEWAPRGHRWRLAGT